MLSDQEKKKAFYRRLRLYLFGVLLGCVLVYFLLIRNRDLGGWLPGNQIIGKIRSNELLFSSNAECMMQCLGITRGDIKKMIDSTATVNMKQSNVHISDCPIYALEDKDKYELSLLVQSCDSSATVLNVARTTEEKTSCDCD
ncbi:MAG: hypothetical protein AB1458_12600 [Bacteroidota bacterium]